MTKYDWDKNTIDSIKNTELKDIILCEYNNQISSNDSVVLEELPIRTFKRIYFEEKRRLQRYNKDLATISDLLPYTLKGKKINLYEYPHQGFTSDIVLDIIKSFIITLNDQELLEYYNYLIDPNNHILKITEYNPDIPITEYIRGRLIHQNDTTYLSYYLKDNITDITCLTHEISHYFAAKIKTNPNFKSFFVEFEAKLMEYLMINYIREKLNDEQLGHMLMQDEIDSIITDIHISFYQRLVANTLSNTYNETKIQKRFNRELNLDVQYPPQKNIILNDKINILKGRVHSGMLALAFIDKLDFDYEASARLYKSILRDQEIYFNKLIEKYNLSLQEYVDIFATHTEHFSLGKILKR